MTTYTADQSAAFRALAKAMADMNTALQDFHTCELKNIQDKPNEYFGVKPNDFIRWFSEETL